MVSGVSPAEQALAALRAHFATERPKPTTLDEIKAAEARDKLSPMQLIAAKIDGHADGAIRREHRLTDTLLVVIDELRQRVTDLEEGMTGR